MNYVSDSIGMPNTYGNPSVFPFKRGYADPFLWVYGPKFKDLIHIYHLN